MERKRCNCIEEREGDFCSGGRSLFDVREGAFQYRGSLSHEGRRHIQIPWHAVPFAEPAQEGPAVRPGFGVCGCSPDGCDRGREEGLLRSGYPFHGKGERGQYCGAFDCRRGGA